MKTVAQLFSEFLSENALFRTYVHRAFFFLVSPKHCSVQATMVSSFAPPNIPVLPRNGMIRTYDNQDRTFTRPYSAKTVFFYKEGDEYFTVSLHELTSDGSIERSLRRS